jgi:hypothetical protein
VNEIVDDKQYPEKRHALSEAEDDNQQDNGDSTNNSESWKSGIDELVDGQGKQEEEKDSSSSTKFR